MKTRNDCAEAAISNGYMIPFFKTNADTFTTKQSHYLKILLILYLITTIAVTSCSGRLNNEAKSEPRLSERNYVLRDYGIEFFLNKEFVDDKFRWISTPEEKMTIYGTHPHILTFRTFGGDEYVEFSLKVDGNDRDIIRAFTIMSQQRQRVGTTVRNPFADLSREERARLIEAGISPDLLMRESWPPSPNRFNVKFSGVSKGAYEHHRFTAQIELTAIDASGQAISKTISITFAKPLEWVEFFESESYIICGQERDYFSRVKYGIGHADCKISGSDNYLNAANFEIIQSVLNITA